MKKFIAIIAIIGILLLQQVSFAQAYEAPTPPPAPTAPTAPTAPSAPSAPTAPTAPDAPTAPTAPTYNPDPTPTEEPTPTATPKPKKDSTDTTGGTGETQNQKTGAEPSPTPTQEPTQSVSQEQGTGGQTASGQHDPSINTGDATTTAVLESNANTNSSLLPTGTGSAGSVTIANTDNGSGSQNLGSATITDSNTTLQNNSASVVNDLSGASTTGQNTASKNVGDTTITTGDANTSGTLITALNTNIAGIAVSEFNVVDDQVGDLVLDFAANCISGCSTGSTSITNSGNGTGSENTGALDQNSTNATFQTNDATVANNMVLDSDSGHNTADKNTGGDTSITTGDANVSANSLTFANNNIAGNVVYGVVNIYADLTGDIIFPEEMLTTCCAVSNTTLANIGNGASSVNTADATITNSDQTYQTNTAVIDNLIYVDAQTGENDVNKNTNGDNSIKTGSANVDAQVVNIANNNVDGGVWWLVLVNEAGNWIGKLMGSQDGVNMAGSAGTEFQVDPTGEISVTNSGNGAGSTNTGSVTQNSSNTTVQTNTAHILNTMDLSANTGGNTASKNTGGNNTIQTGDANVIANLVNFVNNNISSNSKLFVTVVNVFGSWTGNFFTPDAKKALAQNQNEEESAMGGANAQPEAPLLQETAPTQNPSNATNNNSSNSNSTTGTGSQPSPTPTSSVLAVGNTLHEPPSSGAFVLGASSSPQDTNDIAAVQGRKKISINLAWLILLLPCAILLFAVRRIALKLLLRRQTPAFV
ncbi:hypothetical protein A2973_02300 [Candidatus Gottesmanbacteria bacterium RIFCSPLOWO2_01_FULL_49_10]|uniref:Uncharacterized protein n=1 Tax=Candidatus Gottesmanbacteria bacterium RIFCSPLOWO2_01_FULL_49_10 TaxID=1798396 RepID=A0A1F6AZL2_9BACT|nr:MAG: hypothetical protein UY10_C0035G0003 [Microgenomates group bacterium GW2011_GWA2_47_8]OGG30116.1 MAG: hypothetical protein A2973_02300 [Candidatus Gottesmanbacteria bacterium RIFCSPLOWO2_01_FULL_49_10]